MPKLLIEVPIPSMGATVNEITLVDLFCEAGKAIAKGEKLAELESDKSIFDFESPCDGIIKRICCRAGDILEVGAPFLRIETDDASLGHLKVDSSANGETPPDAKSLGEKAEVAPLEEIATTATAVEGLALPSSAEQGAVAGTIRWTPKGKKLALERGLEPNSITDIVGTGPGGRVTGDDVQNYRGTALVVESSGEATANKELETVCVAGIGYAVPKNARSNEEILKEFPGKTAEEIEKVTGIKQLRHQ